MRHRSYKMSFPEKQTENPLRSAFRQDAHFFTSVTALIITTLILFASVNQQEDEVRVLIFGDSITAGYGIGKDNAFPALLDQKADSLGYEHVNFVNGGLSGETSAGGLRRVDWMLRQPVDVFVLELGGNDGLRGLDLDDTKKNLNGILEKVEEKYPEAVLVVAGMQVPPNLGDEYTQEFKKMYKDVAEKHNAVLIPFILEDVGGIKEFNLNDGIHPNAQGHRIIAENIWPVFEKIFKEME